jgi:hypothetical protein
MGKRCEKNILELREVDEALLALIESEKELTHSSIEFGAVMAKASAETLKKKEIARFDAKTKRTIVDFKDGKTSGFVTLHEGDEFDLVIGVALAEAYARNGGKKGFEAHCKRIWKGPLPTADAKNPDGKKKSGKDSEKKTGKPTP